MRNFLLAPLLTFLLVSMGVQEKPITPPDPGTVTVTGTYAPLPPPILAEVDALKIENALLKVQATEVALDKLKAEFQRLLTSHQKPGYQIAQGPDGKLMYVPEPKPVEKKEPK